MAKVLVVYCSLSGNTEVAAQAVADARTIGRGRGGAENRQPSGA